MHGAVVPLTQDPRDQVMYTLDVGFEENITTATSVSKPPRKEAGPSAFGRPETTTLVNKPSAVCSLAVSADIWHRRLGHLNQRSMDILRRQKGTGVEYQNKPSPCDVCENAKHKQTSHPRKTTRQLSRPGQPIYINNMGSIQPPARSKGGTFSYVCKFTDGYSRMKEVFLLRHKNETTEALHAHNMQVAAAGDYRIKIIRCDKGGENTGEEFRTYCKDSGIKIEYTATNIPQQSVCQRETARPWQGSRGVSYEMETSRRSCGAN
ncbi:unnamed protein product [Sphacelaria rigidula]